MRYILVLFLFISSANYSLYSQNVGEPIEPPPSILMEQPDVMPKFPGGEAALYKYLSTNIIYPHTAQEQEISGKVYVRFIIDQEGNVTDVKIVKSVHKELDNEAMRAVKNMPQWEPATSNGKPVKCLFNLPVNFVLR